MAGDEDPHLATFVVVRADGTYQVDMVRMPTEWRLPERVALASDGEKIVGYRDAAARMSIRGRLEALVRTGARRPLTRSQEPMLPGGATAEATLAPVVVAAECQPTERCMTAVCVPDCGTPGSEFWTCKSGCKDCTVLTICG
jgi:hypothetical protein